MKRDGILWGFTLGECLPYYEHHSRKIMFTEAVLKFLGVKDEEREKREMIEDYCFACRHAGKDTDCDTCLKDIRAVAHA